MKYLLKGLFLFLFLPELLFAQSRITVQVVDNFTKAPVVSELIIVEKTSETPLGVTDNKGFYTIECTGGAITLRISPVDRLRHYGRKIVCGALSPDIKPNTIDLLSKNSETAINLTIDSLTQKNRYADVAYFYNLQAENYRLTDSASAVTANQRQSWIYMAKYLNVKRSFVFDSTNQDYRISPELGTAVEKYQRSRNLPTLHEHSGDLILDLYTTEKASKTHLHDVMASVPGTVIKPG